MQSRRRRLQTLRTVALSVVVVFASSSLPPAVEEAFCAVAANCVDDRLSVRFPDVGSASVIADMAPGDELVAEIFLDVKSRPVQGVSLGVKQDTEFFEIVSARLSDEARDLFYAGDAESRPIHLAADGKGFVMAGVVTFDDEPPFELPLGEIKLVVARYRMLERPLAEGTRIQFTNELGPPGSPATAVNLTVAGTSKQPRFVDNGLVKGATAFARGDANGDTRIDITDVVVVLHSLFTGGDLRFACDDASDIDDNGVVEMTDPIFLFNHLFAGGPRVPEPFSTCGPDLSDDPFRCREPNC